MTGGGIDDYGAAAELQNVTIAKNRAVLDSAIDYQSYGGILISPLNMDVSNSVVEGTCASPGIGSLRSLGYNPESETSCSFLATTDSQNADAQLGPLRWLGLTPFLPLGAGSPAIDHGDPARCAPLDQLGASRVGVCDAGAVEAAAK